MNRPSALRMVAWLFIASGVWAAGSMIETLFVEHDIVFNLELLGLWIGPGLLRYEARYRRWALRLLIVEFAVVPVAVLLSVFQPQSLVARILGGSLGPLPRPAAFAALAVTVGLAVWQYWVLRRADVVALFTRTLVDHRGASV